MNAVLAVIKWKKLSGFYQDLKQEHNSFFFVNTIGNWNFDCRSHYWIRRNEVHMAPAWPEWKIKANREKDIKNKKDYEKNQQNEKND
jgi:hypothetical protein